MKLDDMKKIIDESPYKDQILKNMNDNWALPFLAFLFLDKEEIEKLKEEYENER